MTWQDISTNAGPQNFGLMYQEHHGVQRGVTRND